LADEWVRRRRRGRGELLFTVTAGLGIPSTRADEAVKAATWPRAPTVNDTVDTDRSGVAGGLYSFKNAASDGVDRRAFGNDTGTTVDR